MTSARFAVDWIEGTLQPRAECDGCDWKLMPASVPACRAHVAATGHEVIRIRETRTGYYPRSAS